MKPKGKPESKIPTTKTNKKRAPEVQNKGGKLNASLLKKNEFALIILGALLLTIIIFFLFFRSTGPKIDPVKKSVSSTSFADIEKKIKKIEQVLQIQENSVQSPAGKKVKGVERIDPVEERLTRLETAFSVRFDSLIERMGKIEKNISQLKNKPTATMTPKSKPKPSIPVKKAVKKEKKTPMFHTVQKGETLYSISKKYNTSIASLQKLNNLSTKAKIYPGDNILIR
ncbi:MAG: LysM peptidoglycan-binding domain-containing protein [Desulfobacula sp.]|uniref:LysM peptidoglycan-binding domain-containing protein n=1 Tax=Desulfobacula sp. TaxID=2593537 RepID=UPI0025C4DB65|nr:LysM peptidoglycan-binding domain-containing protein [Desulfobacula sp.]MCD4722657.1 LysM peptidoglycan-binding domain-containing protein [Desulfobacula sp.]